MDANCSELNSTTQALGLVVPNDENWNERTAAWYVTFDIMLVLFGLLNIGLAVFALMSLCKRRSTARFKKVRTFIAIDSALLTLGVSRALFVSLDPWGQNGYFTCQGCVIFSRLVSSLAFPSLTASYTLLFITLWVSAKMHLGSLMIQKLKVLVPLCFLHYIVAIVFEIIITLPLPPYPIVILVIICEGIFSLWGIVLSITFMVAGVRLLHVVKVSARSSSMVCRDSTKLSRHDPSKKQEEKAAPMRHRQRIDSRNEAQEKHRRAVNKIARITYLTASLAIFYSALIIVNLVFLCLNLFDGCPGKIGNDKLSPELWLILRFLQLTIEQLLAALLSYSNTDYRAFKPFLKRVYNCTKKAESSKRVHQNENETDLSRLGSTTSPRTRLFSDTSTATSQERQQSSPLPHE